jgi:alcohol dehydrogenase
MNAPGGAGLLERLSFVHQLRTRIVSGLDSVNSVGSVAREFATRSVLLVTDPGLVAAGHAGRVYRLLEKAGLCVALFDRVQENPTTDCVAACLQTARAAGIEALVALGGGSAMDTAKGCNFLLTNGGEMKDYWGVGKAAHPLLPLIAIPTTAGTGSEMQSAALIADARTHQKMACLDAKATARVAILDPALTLSQPARVTASTGIDALAHALESSVARNRNAISQMYAREAFRLAMTALPQILRNPGDLETRGQMLLAAALAGAAIENSMLGAAHAAANPLTAHYNIVHGQAVGLMLPHVIRFNAWEPAARQVFAELCSCSPGLWPQGHSLSADEVLAQRVEGLLHLAGLPRDLGEAGVEAAAVPMLAAEAAQQWTAGFNPRAVAEADFVALYQAAFVPCGPAPPVQTKMD